MKIESTTEYGIFHAIKGNREISKPHVNRLIKAIEKENLLAYSPIIVNKQMQVIDGQHRLEAAKKLKEPIYYIIDPDATIDEVMSLNANSKIWTSVDFANSYAERGKLEYIALLDFSKRHDLTIPICIEIVSADPGSAGKNRFKLGTFKGRDWADSERIAEYAFALRPFMDYRVVKSKSFYRALRTYLGKEKEVPDSELLDKYAVSDNKIGYRPDIIGYLRQFEDTLMWNRRDGKQLRLY